MKSWFKIIIAILFVAIGNGCKEIFDPEIDANISVLVVEGVITNQPGPYYVKLSWAGNYGVNETPELISSATVNVNDNNNINFQFLEIQPGIYESPPELEGVVGGTYTLIVTLPDGEIYSSFPQTILPSTDIQSLNADSTVQKTYTETKYGDLILNETPGVEVTIKTNTYPENNPLVRFNTNLIALYTWVKPGPDPMLPDQLFYCWKFRNNVEGINNINKPTSGNQVESIDNTVIAFIPNDRSFFGLDNNNQLFHVIVKVSLYSLNEDSYQFYSDVSKQLSSDGSLFSPVASQLFTNIYCVTNPEKKAAGLFEASSVVQKDYVLWKPPLSYYLMIEETENFINIPPPNCLLEEKPWFWIN